MLPARSPWWALNPVGALLGLAWALASVTPSLVPRPAVLQGAIAALGFGIGYLLGVGLAALLRRLTGRSLSVRARRRLWIGYAAAWLTVLVLVPTLALHWQNEVRRLVSMAPLGAPAIGSFLFGFMPLTVLLLASGRGIQTLGRRLSRRHGRAFGIAAPAGMVIGALVLVGAGAVAAVNSSYLQRNGAPEPAAEEPASAYRSAGPGSAIAWHTVGRHGGNFLAGGPSAATIAETIGRPALEPIRVYAGVASAPTVQERADLVVAELERTGAFRRSVLVVATTTGSGWLEPQTMDSLEYLHAGDTAIAALQYSYAPSWVSFVFQPDAPIATARTLFEAVHARWAQLPETDRPKLISYGLSLGAHGSQAVFTDLADVRSRTDGALFVGSPNGSALWRQLQARRDPGSPAWQPVLDGGREVRWRSRADDEQRLTGPWEQPRVLYLQHATDAVTWLSPELLWRSPEWLDDDQRSPDISSAMTWLPLITAVQVTVDMLVGENVPASYGHNFGDVVTTAWREVTGDAGLDEAAVARVDRKIAAMASIQAYAVHE